MLFTTETKITSSRRKVLELGREQRPEVSGRLTCSRASFSPQPQARSVAVVSCRLSVVREEKVHSLYGETVSRFIGTDDGVLGVWRQTGAYSTW